MPAVDIRELVNKPIRLTGNLRARSQPHPLDPAIVSDRRFSSPNASPIYLPSSGRGFHRLKSALSQPIAGLDDALAREAHVRLLSEGHGVLRELGAVRLDANRDALSEADFKRARSAVVTAVFCDDDERLEGGQLSTPRFAAIGTLSVLPHPSNVKWSEDAWLEVEWFYSTGSLAQGLQQVRGLLLQPPAQNRLVEMLVAEAIADEDDSFIDDVVRIACVLGARLIAHVLRPERIGEITGHLKSMNPTELLVVGVGAEGSALSQFVTANGTRDLHRAEVSTAAAGRQWVLDNLPRMMGVSAGLIGHPEVQPVPGRPRMPVSAPVECLHQGVNTYVRDDSTDLWWTRDFAQHGSEEKSIFKTYSSVGGLLLWQGDHDAQGRRIDGKHKGHEGRRLEQSSMNACSHPESHLG